MRVGWEAVRLAAQKVCARPHDSIRLSNLCILAALAFDAELITKRRTKLWNTLGLRRSLDAIALSPLPQLRGSETAWNNLASVAQSAASIMESLAGPHEWVAAFQAAESGQKTKGAYATPSTFD